VSRIGQSSRRAAASQVGGTHKRRTSMHDRFIVGLICSLDEFPFRQELVGLQFVKAGRNLLLDARRRLEPLQTQERAEIGVFLSAC